MYPTIRRYHAVMRFTLTLALLLAGCGQTTRVDGGVAMDGGGGADAATMTADGGSGTDAGPPGDAGVDCSTAEVDTPCAVEGAYCGGPCTDACSFCNILSCSGGTWNRVEVFPTPCFACGDAQCVTEEQHCVHSYSDVGGEPDGFGCADNPAECVGEMATCACLGGSLTFDECVEPSAGEVEIRYFGG